jgi:hypothetical protein
VPALRRVALVIEVGGSCATPLLGKARLVGGRYRPAHAVRSARILRLLALTDVSRVVILSNTRLRGPFARPNTARIHSPPWHAGWFPGVVAQFDLARRLPWTPLPYFSSSSLCFLLPAVAFTAEAAGIKLTDVATAIQHVVAGILCSSALVSLRQKPMRSTVPPPNPSPPN